MVHEKIKKLPESHSDRVYLSCSCHWTCVGAKRRGKEASSLRNEILSFILWGRKKKEKRKNSSREKREGKMSLIKSSLITQRDTLGSATMLIVGVCDEVRERSFFSCHPTKSPLHWSQAFWQQLCTTRVRDRLIEISNSPIDFPPREFFPLLRALVASGGFNVSKFDLDFFSLLLVCGVCVWGKWEISRIFVFIARGAFTRF